MKIRSARRARVARRTSGARFVPLCVLALACASAAPLPPASAGVPQRVLLVSVSGLTSWALWDMPVLSGLAADGALADDLESVTPPTAYPAHATLVTGAPPAEHGIVADRLLGERGVRTSRYSHASHLKLVTLWQRSLEAGHQVASLDWPSTQGSSIPLLLPDSQRPRDDASWLEAVADATPRVRELLLRAGRDRNEATRPGPQRDALLTGVACALLTGEGAPRLLMLRLQQAAPAMDRHGPRSPQARLAFAEVDQLVGRLVGCLADAGRLESAAFVVVGDHGSAAVHTEVAPNVVLAREGLLRASGSLVDSWSAIARSNGGTAFIYAREENAAVRARVALENAGHRTGAFRVITAEEMIRGRADTDAWFGIEAEPGFVFVDTPRDPVLAPSSRLASGGFLPEEESMRAALVAWGRGIRSGIQLPGMRQTDVAPTLAELLGLKLETRSGRVLVGMLTPLSKTSVSSGATPPAGQP